MNTNSSFSIFDWCHDNHNHHSDDGLLALSSQLFIKSIEGASYRHPFCMKYVDSNVNGNEYYIADIPKQGPIRNDDISYYGDTIYEKIQVRATMYLPELLALTELWLRLFAIYIIPMTISYLLYYIMTINTHHTNTFQSLSLNYMTYMSIITLLSCIVIMTDTMYILEYNGKQYGILLFMITNVLLFAVLYYQSTSRDITVIINKQRLRNTIGKIQSFFVILVVGCYYYDSSILKQSKLIFNEQVTHIKEGLYYDKSNLIISNAINNHWSKHNWDYDDENHSHNITRTQWMITGDSRTGLPFLLNHVNIPKYTRIYLNMPHDNEVIALDIAFPKVGGYNPYKPLYFILHGLNGGSSEEYVRDFVWRRLSENSTIIVMIARGLMNLPIRGWNTFHGARWEDSYISSLHIKNAMKHYYHNHHIHQHRNKGPINIDDKNYQPILAGVGYSMGAIILNNFISRTGINCPLDIGVSISGGLDMRYQIYNHRAQRLWQPMLTNELRNTFVLGKWGERVKQRLSKQQMKQLLTATHITDIDKTAVVAYNGYYRDVVHYYSEMSVLGDIPYNDKYTSNTADYYRTSDHILSNKRIHNISIPLLVIHALDDPLITWRTVGDNHGLMTPTNLTKTGSGNLVLLLTKRGGHVGWPLGWKPQDHNWQWMSDAASSFVNAIVLSKKQSKYESM